MKRLSHWLDVVQMAKEQKKAVITITVEDFEELLGQLNGLMHQQEARDRRRRDGARLAQQQRQKRE